MHDSFSQPNVEQSTMQLVVDQLEELIVTIIEEIRERPGVAAAILAAVVGAFVGSMLAANVGRRGSLPPAKVARSARGLGDAAELVGLGVRLLQNPLVRAFAVSALQAQLRKRMPI
jgi:uncharacterized membrane protein YeaQ/YmgE (transglycosylase-associated protein family)